MFFNSFDENVRKIFKEDIDKYLVISWIIFNANYQELYDGLGHYECYFSHGLMMKIFGFSKSKSAKIIEELVKENHIVWVKKSVSKHDKSIVKLLIIENGKKNGNENSDKNSDKNSESIDAQRKDVHVRTVKETVKRTVKSRLSKNISNQCVYKLLPQAPHVKLTEEQFNNLVQEHGVEYIEDIILDLEDDIVNGDGAKYKDHDLKIRSWIRYRQSRKPNTVVHKQTPQQPRTKPKKQERFTNIAQHNWNFSSLEQAEELLQAMTRGEITEYQYQEAINQLAVLN